MGRLEREKKNPYIRSTVYSEIFTPFIFSHLVLVRSDSYAFVRNSLHCTKWSLFEMVFVRSDLTPRILDASNVV